MTPTLAQQQLLQAQHYLVGDPALVRLYCCHVQLLALCLQI